MANNPGARKSVRKIARRTEVNKARRSRVRTYLRKFEEALAMIRKVTGTKFDARVVEAMDTVIRAGLLRPAPALVEA